MRAAISPVARFTRLAPRRLSARSVRVRAMSKEPIFDIAVKGDPETSTLGDCPFCHRALLVLEEKHVPYSKTYIDFAAKPQWLFEVNPAGTVPVMKELATGEWIVDSGVIAEALEKRFPEPAHGIMEGAGEAGGAIFNDFKEFAKSSDAEAAAKEVALEAAFRELEDYLKEHGGPYVGGAQPRATDMSLMPKLYHATAALKHFRGWELPAEFKAVRAYMAAFMARESWEHTLYSEALVIQGWERHGLEVKRK